MTNRFIIPGSVAASLHAIVFFCLPSSKTIIERVHATTDSPPPFTLPLELEEPAEESGDVAAAAGNPDLPRTPDLTPPATAPDSFTVPVEAPPVSQVVNSDPRVIGPIGPLDGIGTGPRAPGIVSFASLDHVPETRARIAPVYPMGARQSGRRGEVVVEFVVDESGRVVNPRIVRSNDPIFEEPTLRAISRWRFEPGRKNGRAVRFRMAMPVQFELNED